MSFSFTAPSQPYSNTPIIIADGSGANSMTFAGIQEPTRLPELTNNRHVRTSRTRPGATYPGYRIQGSFGSSDNLRDLHLDLPLLTPAQFAQLLGYFNARPGVFSVSIDKDLGSGIRNIYFAMFKENGLVPRNYDFNQRCFTAASLDMFIINKTTSVAFS